MQVADGTSTLGTNAAADAVRLAASQPEKVTMTAVRVGGAVVAGAEEGGDEGDVDAEPVALAGGVD